MEMLKGTLVSLIKSKVMCIFLVAATGMALAACSRHSNLQETSEMTELSLRLQPLFNKTKPVCFGRFMVDLPESVTVAWGGTDVPLGISVYPNGAEHVDDLAIKFINELKAEKAIYHNHVPLLVDVSDVRHPEGKIVTGYEDFESINGFKIQGYFKLGGDGAVILAQPLRENMEEAVALINSSAQRLRLRTENEVPAEPGNCIENAFLSDSVTRKDERRELIRIGFRLKEFPDVHLSISLGPSNPHHSETNSLEWQLARLERNLKAEDANHPRLKTRYLRRGTRKINDLLEGFEVLSHTPDEPEARGIHDFALDVRGTPSDPFRPRFDIRLETGVSANTAGATKPSLTDEEAVAVWDKIVSTIRVRPTNAAATKNAGTTAPPRLPLGELAATGRTCPQTGWWQSSEGGGKEGGERRHIQSGERMPHVTTAGAPSLWQKLKGEQPSYRTATTWKLVGYDDVAAPADNATPPSGKG